MHHLPDLTEAARYDDIWTYLDEPTPQDEQPVKTMIVEALGGRSEANASRSPSSTRRPGNHRDHQLHRHSTNPPKR
jgi:hypothetical protein